ncbi:FAD/NAD(P)-binding protein [Rhodoferax sp.]|uniref:NAD(P)-binding protein n=1 Tax=Rhodoferax sp. TaxID=50421 RepID=UPI0025E10303|nr:FAD/NAD(P)-binding protein [Rhodoferax sp.]
MQHIETDYLVIGSGAVGLAFADTLIDETDAHITMVDRHGKPGGHWNDAYPFVALHQPSAFYGVNSMPLGNNRKDTIGVNKGLYELASGPEVSAYFERVMNQKLLPSGRVSYHPMCDYVGDGRFVSILSGVQTQVNVRKKTVDATYFGTQVPATHTPKFKVGDGAWLITPNALPQLWQGKRERPRHFMIIGAGKTAMDVGIWLLNSGAQPDAISWVMPRDSWLVNRLHTQPGPEFFNTTIGGQADQMGAFANASSIDDLFKRLEDCEAMLRIYPEHKPGMFHYATMSKGEVEVLRTIRNVIRLGHVQSIEADQLVLDRGTVPMSANTLCIDCTASAVEKRPIQPIFQGDKIVPQLVRVPLPTFSAAMIAYVEAHYDDDATKNQICGTVPFPDSLESYPASTAANMMNQFKWSQDKPLRQWIRESRLDGFGKLIAEVDRADEEKMGILAKYKANAMLAMTNIAKLMATQKS